MGNKVKLFRTIAATLLAGFCFAATTPALYAKDDGEDSGRGRGHDKVTALNIVPVITSLQVVNGQLMASGIASGVVNGKAVFAPFSNVAVTLSVVQPSGGAPGRAPLVPVTCPVLNLQLGPIHLDLLGLVVDTSQICLNITAMQGGGLLGDLLCGVANLLNAGTPLGGILGSLTTTDLNNLLLGITAILNGALANLNNAVVAAVTQAVRGPTCDILNLSLGPIDLNLLGLDVTLNNCANGPVTVDITGRRGALLGNLLCGLLGGGGGILGTPLGGLLGGLLGL